MMNGMVGAHLSATAAANALLVVNEGPLVLKADGSLWTDLAARVSEAALAGTRHAIDVVLARIARKLNYVDQRRLIVGKAGAFGLADAGGNAPGRIL
jgi:hypothetical protein